MTIPQSTFSVLLQGWKDYQTLLIKAIAPLTADQLALKSAPHLRSIGELVLHIIDARAGWCSYDLHEGGEEMASFMDWGRPGMPTRSAAEMVNALETTWQLMQDIIARWTPEEWEHVLGGTPEEPDTFTRSWVIWHLIEHDTHHGGEVSLTLGMHGLEAPAL
ncbi:MAG: DinB family protein [Ktedonobacteraceae bacterium]|nr:DinB family protein [Ktedonobacteraceae bacterium]